MVQKLFYWMGTLLIVCALVLVVGCSDSDKTLNSDSVILNDDTQNHDPPGDVAADVVADSLQDKREGTQPTAAAGPRNPLKWPQSMWDFSWPTAYGQAWKITCGYGCYKHTSWNYPGAGYYSVDLVRKYGTTLGSCVTAPARGVVIFSGKINGYGWCVIMDHDYGHTGRGYRSIVAHLRTDPRQYVNVGNDLRAGTILGYAGSSGVSTGPHVHFGVWKNFRPVPLTGISGYSKIVVGWRYYSYCWPVQPPRGRCSCP